MTGKMPDLSEYDTLADTSSYARPIEDFGEAEISHDHAGNLVKLRAMLVKKRRYMVQDVMAYPVVYQARSQDLAQLQTLISAIEQALSHEQRLLADGVEIAG